MKRFIDYLKEISDVDNMSPEAPPMSGDSIAKACKIAWRKYRSRTEKFFQDLAALDPEIKNAMNVNGHDDGPVITAHRRDKDEVVPPSADGSPGIEDGGDGE